MSFRFAHARNSAAPSKNDTVADLSDLMLMLSSFPPLITDSKSRYVVLSEKPLK